MTVVQKVVYVTVNVVCVFLICVILTAATLGIVTWLKLPTWAMYVPCLIWLTRFTHVVRTATDRMILPWITLCGAGDNELKDDEEV